MNFRKLVANLLSLLLVLQLFVPITTVVASTDPIITLVGNVQTELGADSDWDPADVNTQMVLIPDTNYYYLLGEIPAGDYEYKVAYNGNWDLSYGQFNYGSASFENGSNYSLSLTKDQDVLFLFDSVGKRLMAITGNMATDELDIHLAGDMNTWDKDSTSTKLHSLSNGYYAKEYTLEPGDYNYKYIIDQNWDAAVGTSTGGNKTISLLEKSKVLFLFDSNAMTETLLYEEESTRVATLVGSIQSSFGASSNWDPSLTETDMTYYGNGIYYKEGLLDLGDYEYKVAMNNNWDESFYEENTPLNLLETQYVAFLFNDTTKRITDSLGHQLCITGSLQDELGASNDWEPTDFTTATVLKDGLQMFSGTMPEGEYEYKYTIDGSWNKNYGQDGIEDGANIKFTSDGSRGYLFARENLFGLESMPLMNFSVSKTNDGGGTPIEVLKSPVKNNDGTVTFNVSKSDISYNPLNGPLYIIGSFVDWDESRQVELIDDSSKDYLSITLDFENDYGIYNQMLSYKLKYATWDLGNFPDSLNPEQSSGNSLIEIGIAPENLSYHVTGSFQGWGPGDDNYKMEDPDSDGIFTLTLPLAAARYEYKVTQKYKGAITWIPDGQNNNHSVELTSPSEVTIYFNSNLYNAGTNMDPVASSLDMKMVEVYVKDLATGILYGPMIDSEFNGTYVHKFTDLALGEYKFEIVDSTGKQYASESLPYIVNLNENFDLEIAYQSGNDYIQDNYAPNIDGVIDEESLFHDSWDELYRKPFGALPLGTTVDLSLKTAVDDASKVTLVVDGKPYKLDAQNTGSYDLYTKAITFDNIGVHDYYFVIQDGTTRLYYSAITGEGSSSNTLGETYTITMYPSAYTTPDWMKLSITYQIFGDRFNNGDPTNDHEKLFGMGDIPLQFPNWNAYDSYENTRYGQVNPTNYETLSAEKGWDNDWHNEVYGGDLAGVKAKLDYLQEVGVKTIYFNPIFESISAHKYDSADYSQVDPRFGTNEDFELLAKEAKKRGMNIILDGVFNHVGSDSLYFNKYGKNYEENILGAYEAWMLQGVVDNNPDAILLYEELLKDNTQDNFRTNDFYAPYLDGTLTIASPYSTWFNIGADGVYEGWWGYDSLPVIQSLNGSELNVETFADYIIENDDSIARQWIENGSSGWRLDVSPEVSMDFWLQLRDYIKGENKGDLEWSNGEPIILAENWGDATSDFLSGAFDSTMNYRFREAAIEFVIDEEMHSKYNDTGITAEENWVPSDAKTLNQDLMTYFEKYPKESSYVLMNLLGSHDVPRILGVLGYLEVDRPLYPGTINKIATDLNIVIGDNNIIYMEDFVAFGLVGQGELTEYINETNRIARERLELASMLQMTYPGSPTVYYGDEIGMSGYHDPDNRRQFNWSLATPDNEVANYISELAKIRNENLVLQTGEFVPIMAEANSDVYVYGRYIIGDSDALGNTSYITNFSTNKSLKVNKNQGKAIVILNKSASNKVTIDIPVDKVLGKDKDKFIDPITKIKYKVINNKITVTCEPLSGMILLSDKSSSNSGNTSSGNANNGNTNNSSNNGNKNDEINLFEDQDIPRALGKFSDLIGYDWANSAIGQLLLKGIIKGADETHFEPGRMITRAEFTTLLSRLIGPNEVLSNNQFFGDISSKNWYYEDVLNLAKRGYIKGDSSGRFNPKMEISREEVAVIIARLLKEYNLMSTRQFPSAEFSDYDLTSNWAKDSLNLCFQEGIIIGEDQIIGPKRSLTRAEASVIIIRLMDKLEIIK